MAANSKIEWTRHTFNPWRGCTKVSAGCANCYAERLSVRNPAVLGVWGDNGKRVVGSESYWRQPRKWDRDAKAAGERHRVFCASLADVFEDRDELVEPRFRLIALMESTPNLDWLLLTKRPENVIGMTPIWWHTSHWGCGDPIWPSNVWIGTSIENQATADERIPHLLKVPAAVRFLSAEPLLGEVWLRPIWERLKCPDCGEPMADHALLACPRRFALRDMLHWVIVGGESGPGARPMDNNWAQSIVNQCKAAGVAVFVKQLSAGVRANHDIETFPEGLRVREFPKAACEVTS